MSKIKKSQGARKMKQKMRKSNVCLSPKRGGQLIGYWQKNVIFGNQSSFNYFQKFRFCWSNIVQQIQRIVIFLKQHKNHFNMQKCIGGKLRFCGRWRLKSLIFQQKLKISALSKYKITNTHVHTYKADRPFGKNEKRIVLELYDHLPVYLPIFVECEIAPENNPVSILHAPLHFLQRTRFNKHRIRNHVRTIKIGNAKNELWIFELPLPRFRWRCGTVSLPFYKKNDDNTLIFKSFILKRQSQTFAKLHF